MDPNKKTDVDNENEISEQDAGHTTTEEESISSVKKAEKGVKKQAPKRRADKRNPQKTADKLDGKTMPAKESYDYQAKLETLMDNEATLSEEFKEVSSTIFEAAVNSAVSEKIEEIEESNEERFTEELDEAKEEMVEKIDSYLNFVVEQWMEDNKIEIQSGLRNEISEDFLKGLKDLFTESYVEVPESKVDLVDELVDQIAELEEKADAQTEKEMDLVSENVELKREAVLLEQTSDLADTQREKLREMSEKVDFESEEKFTSKVETLKESFFAEPKTKTQSLTEQTESDDANGDDMEEVSPQMQSFIDATKNSARV